MGHAEGICHVYVDAEADVRKAISVVVDAKVDYPAACNAMETLLLHRDTLHNGVATEVLSSLRSAGVEILG
jgi:delta-1-pyrroline-5-carboxylate synthetase